jgi:monovalent cation:H+ antiporter, CPA1 family
LSAFNDQQIRAIFGDRITAITDEIIGHRRQAVLDALDALRLQYPDYIVELEARFLRQSALRREMSRYKSLFEEGLITREIFEDLRRGVLGARFAEAKLLFDIGLDARHLIARLDILGGLDERELAALGKLLRPRLAIPGDRIIRKGDRGDAMFFIASGAVEVLLPERRVRLGSGEFFGEPALLSGRQRQADVVALTYCQLLLLRRADFDRFMKANPAASATINRIAESRAAMNRSDRALSSEKASV